MTLLFKGLWSCRGFVLGFVPGFSYAHRQIPDVRRSDCDESQQGFSCLAFMRYAPQHANLMIAEEPVSRATLSDVAREAGVSLATVDRVLNKRPGVHARTVGRVNDAVQRLNYRPDPAAARLARQRPHRVAFVLPSGSNTFIAMLRDAIADNRPWMDDHRVAAQTLQVDVFEPERLARQIQSLAGHCDTAVVMALDHPLVRAAIDELETHGTGVSPAA